MTYIHHPGSDDPTRGPEDASSQDQAFSGHFESSDSRSSDPGSGSGSGSGDEGGSAFGAGVSGAGLTAKPERKKRAKRSRRKASSKPSDSEEDSRAEGDAREGDGAQRSKKRSRRKKASRSSDNGADGDVAQTDSGTSGEEGQGSEEGRPSRKKASKKKRKATKKARSTRGRPKSDDDPEARPRDAESSTGDEGGDKKRRRRGSRGGRRRKKPRAVTVESIPGEEDDLPELPPEAELIEGGGSSDEGGKTTRKRGGRKRSKKKAPARRSSAEDDEGAKGAKGASKKRKKRTRSTSDKEKREPEPIDRDQMILVNAIDIEEKRVAVVQDERIVDFSMTCESQKTLVNDIYRGKVVNLEPAIGAAFVDFGQGRNGFLHTSDILAMYGDDDFSLDKLLSASIDPDEWAESSGAHGDIDDEAQDDDSPKDAKKSKAKGSKARGRHRSRNRARMPITDLVQLGDPVVVQITKDAIGDKGPTLTTYLSIPGRYLVLMPSLSRRGVSRKIPDEKERRRLKRILASLDLPGDMGVIVRTAGVGKTKANLKRDLEYLLGVWETCGKKLKSGRGPAPLYQESDVASRTLRDLFGSRTDGVIVDDPIVHQELLEFAEKLMPEHVERIKLHDAERPVFHHYGIEQDYEKIFARRVELPSGGSIVFDPTEALVAIDVNSGRTRTDGFDFEEIALKTNLEAVPEIARQIRLRDLGGIVVCDFIDMMRPGNMRAVERALRTALSTDRARSKLGRISQFGLLEMTRQRLGPGTHKKVFTACPRCRGTGKIRTIQSRAAAILRRLGSALTQKGFTAVEVRAHPEVITYLKEDLWDYVRALEHRFEKELRFTEVPDQTEDSVLRYLRADGREVRPGGRRKR